MNGLSVIMATRNRPAEAARAVASILTCQHPDFEVVVVDQSDAPGLGELLGDDPRVRYLPSGLRGVSRGRNLAIAKARHERIVCTDDDCTVPPDWLGQAERGLDSGGDLVLGNVIPADHDRTCGVIPGVTLQPSRTCRVWQRNHLDGMGACMAMTRSHWAELAGFDEEMGVGSRLSAGEEMDFILRSLLLGKWVVQDPDFQVVHHGFRSWTVLPALVQAYWEGTGAAFTKHLRCGQWAVLLLLARLGLRFVRSRSPIADSVRASRWAQLRAFLSGIRKGLQGRVDRQHLRFQPLPDIP